MSGHCFHELIAYQTFYIHSGSQPFQTFLRGLCIKLDAHRYPLLHFHEISGSIILRNQ